MAGRIDWVEYRLQNWARWVLSRGAGVMGYSRVPLASAPMPRRPDAYAITKIPTDAAEASDTDDAVAALQPESLVWTVRECYVGEGGILDKLDRLQIAASTYHARIAHAHRLLADHWTAKDRQRSEERRRVESLTQGARGFLRHREKQ